MNEKIGHRSDALFDIFPYSSGLLNGGNKVRYVRNIASKVFEFLL